MVELRLGDRDRLIGLLKNMTAMQSERSRRAFLNDVGLDELADDIDLAGPTSTVVSEIVTHFASYGRYKLEDGLPECEALGWLLREVRARVGSDRQEAIDEMLARYELLEPGPIESSRGEIVASKENPFGDRGRIEDPARFFDREELLRQIFEGLNKGRNLSLVGVSQVGKSSVLAMVKHHAGERLQYVGEIFPQGNRVLHIDMQFVCNEEDFYEALCDELAIAPPCRGFRLKRRLNGKRYVLCLDEIEKMVHPEYFTWTVRSELRGLAEGADAPLSLLVASRSPLQELFPDNPLETSPLSGICDRLAVEPFDEETVRAFVVHRLREKGIRFSEQQMRRLFAETGGHPQRVQELAKAWFWAIVKEREG